MNGQEDATKRKCAANRFDAERARDVWESGSSFSRIFAPFVFGGAVVLCASSSRVMNNEARRLPPVQHESYLGQFRAPQSFMTLPHSERCSSLPRAWNASRLGSQMNKSPQKLFSLVTAVSSQDEGRWRTFSPRSLKTRPFTGLQGTGRQQEGLIV